MSNVTQLIELQEIDSQLTELREILGDLPRKVDELKSEESDLEKFVADGKEKIKELTIEIDKTELTAKESTGKVEHLKEQLFLVTNNKQYDAIQHEIDFLKTALDETETNILNFSVEKEELEGKIKEAQANLESLGKDLVDRSKKLKQMLTDSSEKKENLKSSREKKRGEFDSSVMKNYDRIYEARDGLVVVEVENGSCGGCGSRVPPQIFGEIKRLEKLHNCDVCSRYLYWINPKD